MPVGNNAAAIAAQVEAIRPKLELLMLTSSILWGRIDTRTDMTPVGSRPTRVPTMPIDGGLFGVGGFDGQDMNRGSGPQEVPGYISCASYLQASEYTAQAEWSTDSSKKAIQDYVTLTHERAMKTFGGYFDVLVQQDGSNTIDTIVSVVTGGLVVNLANYFQSNQIVDIWTAAGGTFVASLQIQVEDIQGNTLWMTTAIPSTVLAGQVIMVRGASGQANTGMFGLKYYNVGANVGNYLGIPRASYPGRYIAANINLNNQSLTPAVVRAVAAQVVLAMGNDVAANTDPVAHCNVDMQSAWENNALTVQSIIMNQVKGDQSVDMLKRNAPTVMGGREILLNPRATPGRIDFIDIKNFSRVETKPTDYYEVGGQTIFPTYGGSGGLQSSNIFYLVYQGNVLASAVRTSSFLSNVAIPKNYLGK